MASHSSKHNRYLRIAFGIFVFLFLGCKLATPVFATIKSDYKEVAASSEQEESKAGKIGSSENDLEFSLVPNNGFQHTRWYICIIHLTHYNNTYQATHYAQITVPPPDL